MSGYDVFIHKFLSQDISQCQGRTPQCPGPRWRPSDHLTNVIHSIQTILTNSLFVVRQNSPITSIDTEFMRSSWKEFADDLLLIGLKEMIWIFSFAIPYLMLTLLTSYNYEKSKANWTHSNWYGELALATATYTCFLTVGFYFSILIRNMTIWHLNLKSDIDISHDARILNLHASTWNINGIFTCSNLVNQGPCLFVFPFRDRARKSLSASTLKLKVQKRLRYVRVMPGYIYISKVLSDDISHKDL